MGCPPPGPDSSKDGTRSCHLQWCKDTLAERLRRRPAKPMGSPRVGSNPTGVVFHWPGGRDCIWNGVLVGRRVFPSLPLHIPFPKKLKAGLLTVHPSIVKRP